MLKNTRNNLVYLDYNATAPLRPEAFAAMQEALEGPHNASSVHSFGRAGRKIIEEARGHVAALVGAEAKQVVFNSGATEGNNTVLRHFSGEKVAVSAIEHPSVLEAAPGALHIPVTREGVVDLDALETLLRAEKPALVSVMAANNETGILQPVYEAAALAHRHGALFHCDAVQAAGRIPVGMSGSGAGDALDFLTLSAHKLGGPQGVGALVVRVCGVAPVLLRGGGQERSMRAGTENVAGIAGFGAAAQAALDGLATFGERADELQKHFEKNLLKISGLSIYGQNISRLPNTTLVALPGGLGSETVLMALDLEGIAVSNGSACSSGRIAPSSVLRAMGESDERALSALRISWGWDTVPADLEAFSERFAKIVERLRRKD